MASPNVDITTAVSPTQLPRVRKGDTIVLLGSCFATEVGRRLLELGERAIVNPLGTLFNPISMADTIQRALLGLPPRRERFITRDGCWVSFDCHSDCNGRTPEELAKRIAQGQNALREGLIQAKMVVATFGTSLIFRHQGEVVANCHKRPSKEFSEALAQVEEIVEAWRKTLRSILSINPEAQIVLTVSPVRHLLSGIHRNAVSKALLLKAAMQLAQDEARCHYFPSFEIVLDELRDYRYFQADLAHPAQPTINIVAQRFWQAVGRANEQLPPVVHADSPQFMPILTPPRLMASVETPQLPRLDIARPIRCIGSLFAHSLAKMLSRCGLFARCTPSLSETRETNEAYTILCIEAEQAELSAEEALFAKDASVVLVSPCRAPSWRGKSSAYSHATAMLKAQYLLDSDPRLAYFPAYEILHDELRDYRFYAEDLLSPSPVALRIIVARLVTSLIEHEDLVTLQRYERLQRTLSHRPSNPGSPADLALRQKLQEDAKALLPKLHPAVGAKLIF